MQIVCHEHDVTFYYLCLFTKLLWPTWMLHGFTASGLTETKYISACEAAHIGHVDERYISRGNSQD